ncbi:MAG: NAD(+) diphosphatase [Pseudomonadota bacterium]
MNPNAFLGNPLDRCNTLRKDPSWVERQAAHPKALLLPLHNDQPLIDRGDTTSQLQWLTLDALSVLANQPEAILLGLKDDIPYWAADVSDDSEEGAFADLGTHMPLRAVSPFLPLDELAIAGQAAWLLDWHRRHRFCAHYGHETKIEEAGLKRVNPETGTEHFPRTDPVAIILPTHGDHVCLGHGANFPSKFYSAFAGYVEACETLEECAVRELMEETGLAVTSLDYIFSQPWPFPSSLMVGFIGEVETQDLTLDREEILDAQWLSREEAAQAMAGQHPTIKVPPPIAIANQLLKVWLAR